MVMLYFGFGVGWCWCECLEFDNFFCSRFCIKIIICFIVIKLIWMVYFDLFIDLKDLNIEFCL